MSDMKFFRAIAPNLSIAFSVSLLVVLYVGNRNPMMGFFSGAPFAVLMVLSCFFSIASSVTLYRIWRKRLRKSVSRHSASNITEKLK